MEHKDLLMGEAVNVIVDGQVMASGIITYIEKENDRYFIAVIGDRNTRVLPLKYLARPKIRPGYE